MAEFFGDPVIFFPPSMQKAGIEIISAMIDYPNIRPRESKPQPIMETVDGCPVRTLFIANLPLGAQEKDVLNIFKRFGNVIRVRIVHNRNTERKFRFGFVTYEKPCQATQVLHMKKKNFSIYGQKLYISMADSWHQPVENPDGTLSSRRRTLETNYSDNDEDETVEEEMIIPDSESCPVHRLNDDCLHIIFTYIPLHERPIIGAVCRRWRDITNIMWSSVRELDFSKPPLFDITLNQELLTSLIEKCDNLTTLNLCQDGHRLDSTAIATIAKLCKKLENLSFQEMNLQNRSLALLAHSCPNLKSFAMEDCTNCHEGEVISLIKRCPTLESISMKRNMSLRGYWLKQLRQPLRRLSLNACQFNPAHLIQGIINVKDSLKELNLTACYTIRCSDLDIITGYLPGLVSLKLAGVFPDFKAHTLSHISKLKSLVKLNLERNLVVCDDFIQDLLDNCPNISTINLSCTDSSLLSQGGLCLVAKFPALTHLALAYLSRLTDSTLKTIAQEASNLRRLNLTGCTSVTDDGCTSVVSLCHSLEHLDISGCHSVTKATVSSAIKSAKMGIKKTKLTIVIGESGVDLESNWESPHVNIDRNSNCAQYGLESDEHLFFFDLMDNEVQFLNPGAYDVLNFYDVDALDFDEPFDYDVWSDDSNYSDESFEY